jgi:hypothetical protein
MNETALARRKELLGWACDRPVVWVIAAAGLGRGPTDLPAFHPRLIGSASGMPTQYASRTCIDQKGYFYNKYMV